MLIGGKRGGDERGIGMLIAGEEVGGGNGGTDMEGGAAGDAVDEEEEGVDNGGTDMEGGAASDAVDEEEEVGEIEGEPTTVAAMGDGGDIWGGKIADDPVPVTGGANIVVVKGIDGGP